jgi:hypothetical protein
MERKRQNREVAGIDMNEINSTLFMRYILTFIPFGIILLIVVSFLPLITIEIAPESKIKVVNCDEQAVSDVSVTQIWLHSGYSKDTNIEERKTDPSGFVVFPKREIIISISDFLFGQIFGKSNLHHLEEGKEKHYSFGIENEGAHFLKEGEDNKLVLCNE